LKWVASAMSAPRVIVSSIAGIHKATTADAGPRPNNPKVLTTPLNARSAKQRRRGDCGVSRSDPELDVVKTTFR
jgi:hypothetical protein